MANEGGRRYISAPEQCTEVRLFFRTFSKLTILLCKTAGRDIVLVQLKDLLRRFTPDFDIFMRVTASHHDDRQDLDIWSCSE